MEVSNYKEEISLLLKSALRNNEEGFPSIVVEDLGHIMTLVNFQYSVKQMKPLLDGLAAEAANE